MKNWTKLLFLPILIFAWACEKEEFELGTPPSEADAIFTFETDAQGDNYIKFSNASDAFIKKWDFGNGTSAEGEAPTAYFPFAGDYEVTLTVFTSGGSASASQIVTIAETDPEICNVEILQLLTGGCDAPNGKTWVIDKDRAGHFGLGPATSFGPDWYQAGANEKTGGGMYDDEYTFILNESKYIQETNGDIYLNGGVASNFAGSFENPDVGDFTAPYEAPEDLNYSISEDGDGNTFLNISNQGFIGYATGVSSYQILSITETEMFVRFKDVANGEFAWYHRLIPAGFEPISADFSVATNQLEATFTNSSLNATDYSWDFGDGNASTEESPVHTYAAAGTYTVILTATGNGQTATAEQEVTVTVDPIALPLDFESLQPSFETFGGSTFAYIANPDQSGINTSATVLETVHGDQPWAGMFVDLDEPLDYTNSQTIYIKVWAPTTGTFRLKLENTADANDFIEVDQSVDVANQWVQLAFDVSGAVGKSYARVVIFPGWDVANAGTFYVDDIAQEEVTSSPLALPLDFETTQPTFETFGGSTFAYITNPDQSGINTSSNVLETVHGDQPWAGLFVDLDQPLDYSNSQTIYVKVWAPSTGTFRLKLENIADSNDFIEVDQTVDVASQWVELAFDVSAAAGKSYARVVIFPGWDVANAGTFYVDDISQESTGTAPLGLPLNFESVQPTFETFGGSTYAYITNPDQSGINTSANVLETAHGDQPWAGLFVDLDAPLDYSSSTTISLKVWAPTTGTFRLKLENIADSNDFIEVDQTVDTANQWVELTFDVSAAVGQSYARVVIFPGWDVANAGTFYVDDITQ